MKKICLVLVVLFSFSSFAFENWLEFYSSRYGVDNVDEKIIDNQGNGFDELYGLRNMRVILKGVAYRGGANNYYHRTNRRNNVNPLPEDGIEHLCKDGFGAAVYLYSTRFETATHYLACDSLRGANEFRYHKLNPLSQADLKSILKLVYETLMDYRHGPVYLHCWNGWHASGLASASVLKQFCDYTSEQAVAYWDRNTDGNNTNPKYERIRQRIRNFEPIKEFQISEELKAKVCL